MTRSSTTQKFPACGARGANNPSVGADRQSTQTQFDPLLKPAQAAAMLAVEVGTLEVWRSTKRYPIPYVKVGRSVRYRLSAINAFLAASERAS